MLVFFLHFHIHITFLPYFTADEVFQGDTKYSRITFLVSTILKPVDLVGIITLTSQTCIKISMVP